MTASLYLVREQSIRLARANEIRAEIRREPVEFTFRVGPEQRDGSDDRTRKYAMRKRRAFAVSEEFSAFVTSCGTRSMQAQRRREKMA